MSNFVPVEEKGIPIEANTIEGYGDGTLPCVQETTAIRSMSILSYCHRLVYQR